MTTPRWIAEALDSLHHPHDMLPDGIDAAATALIERLPLEAMGRCNSLTALMRVLTDDDPEVVELTELYQGACKALDDAGVPYGQEPDEGPTEQLNLSARIRWLAEQRPTRLDLQRVEAERDAAFNEREEAGKEIVRLIDRNAATAAERDQARGEMLAVHGFLRAAHEELTIAGVPQSPTDSQHMMDSALARRVRALRDERDHLQKMYEGASDDLDRERSAHQEAVAAAANREIALTVELDNARAQAQNLKAAVVERNTFLRSLIESDMPAHDLRRALADLIGADDWKLHIADLERETLRAKVADQAAYIEQIEVEIDALEDQIDSIDRDPDLPNCWAGCEVGAP